MHFRLYLLICAALLVPDALPAWAGAWPQQEGACFESRTEREVTTAMSMGIELTKLQQGEVANGQFGDAHVAGTTGLTCVSGHFADRRLEEFSSTKTRWETWLAANPGSRIMK